MSASKKTERKSHTLTTKCYNKALYNLKVRSDEQSWAMKDEIRKEYLRLVRMLPTESLELILYEHNEHIVIREENTIEEILCELAQRILIEGEQ